MSQLKRIIGCLTVGITPWLAASAMGQNLPSTAQPGRATEQLQQAPKLPPAPSTGILTPTDQQDVPDDAEDVKFTFKSLEIRGVTTYTQAQLKPFYESLIGREASLNDIYTISRLLTQKYLTDGYMLARVVVPEQEVTDGHIILQAVEGYVGQVYYQGEDGEIGKSTSLQRSIARRLQKSRPLQARVLERNILLLNEVPGQTARAVIKASPDKFGAADVYILTTKKRVDGYIQADNRGNRYQGPLEYVGGISINQVFDDRDRLNLRGATTYQNDELKFGEIGYERLLNSNGLRLSLSANENRTQPGAQLKPFEIKGKDNLYEARLSYPILRDRQTTADVYGTFDWRDVSSDVLGTPLSRDHLRVLRAGTTFQNFDSLNGSNTALLEFSQGLDAFGASEKGGTISRPAASPGFQKLNAQISREQGIRGSAWSIYGNVSGQYAPRALLSSEEFGLGGERIGSAYDSSEITGESGIGARLEARYLVIPKSGWMSNVAQSIQPYAFYDIGTVHNVDAGTGQNPDQSLASAGGGVRMNFKHGFIASLEVSKPLTRNVAALNDNFPRVFFKVGKVF